MSMKKTIVIFSNPFGFGPTGKAIAIAEAFLKDGYKDVVFAASEFIQEIIPEAVRCININERSQEDIENLLKGIVNPIVVSSQNRFAVYAAKALGVPSAFLDGLSWFWDEIPADHMMADVIFWMNYPNIEKKLPQNRNNIYIVPAILNIHSDSKKGGGILMHIGGCKNPLVETFPRYYLNILAGALAALPDGMKITLTGGSDAIKYLKTKFDISNDRIKLVAFKHQDFINVLSRSDYFITTAGQTATLEAFALGIPTSFLLPTNLSQLALTKVLGEYDAAPHALDWNDYIEEKERINATGEKEAIMKFEQYAEILNNNDGLCDKFNFDLKKLAQGVPKIDGQRGFIEHIGMDGANVIKDILIKQFQL